MSFTLYIVDFPPSSPGPACSPSHALTYPQQTCLPMLYYLCALCLPNRSVHSGSPTPRPTLCLPNAFPCPTYNRLCFPVPVPSWYIQACSLMVCTILHHFCFLTIQTGSCSGARIKATLPPTLTSASLFHVLHTTGFAFQCLFPHGSSNITSAS